MHACHEDIGLTRGGYTDAEFEDHVVLLPWMELRMARSDLT